MKLQEFFSKLKFQPMSTIPDVADRSGGDQGYKTPVVLPEGIVLRRSEAEINNCKKNYGYTPNPYVLLGHEVAGSHTKGCDCCSRDWQDVLHRYDGWAWLPGLAS